MSFTRLIYDDGHFYGYYSTCKLQNNQTVAIYFFRNQASRGYEYNVAFAIANKRKHIKNWLKGEGGDVLSDRSTGKCGLDGLVWAKQQIIEFEKFIPSSFHRSEEVIICIGWADNRRRDVYEHYLKRIGYKMGYRDGSKCLFKKIA